LRLFDADAHLKGFELDGNADIRQHLDGVASAVPDAEQDDVGVDVPGGRLQADDDAIDDLQAIDSASK
jgi:hypothetical protein